MPKARAFNAFNDIIDEYNQFVNPYTTKFYTQTDESSSQLPYTVQNDPLPFVTAEEYVTEEYQEKTASNRAFTYDTIRYEGKERYIVERAIASGVLNDTEASHRLVDLAAKLYSRTGVEFELSKTKDTESRTEKISYTAARENESTEDLHIESVSDDMITSPNGNVKGKYSLSTQNSGREGLSSVDNFKVSEYTHSIDARETNSNAIYSVGDPKWHTSFPQYVVKELGQRVERGAQTSTRFITDTANWYKTRINGVEYFVIYSTEESKPTVLYAAKDKRAEREREYLLDWIEVRKNAQNNDRKSSTVSRVSTDSWLRYGGSVQDNIGLMGSESNIGNASVLQRKSKRYSSRAFEDVVGNIFEISDRSNGRGYSLTPQTDESSSQLPYTVQNDPLPFVTAEEYVTEEYQEKTASNRAFTYDTIRYEGKERYIVERAIASGVLNDTEASHRLVDLAAKLYSRTGVEFELSKTKDGRTILYATKGKIKRVGNAEVNSLVKRGSGQNSNSNNTITSPNGNVKVFIATKKRLFSLFFCNFKSCRMP